MERRGPKRKVPTGSAVVIELSRDAARITYAGKTLRLDLRQPFIEQRKRGQPRINPDAALLLPIVLYCLSENAPAERAWVVSALQHLCDPAEADKWKSEDMKQQAMAKALATLKRYARAGKKVWRVRARPYASTTPQRQPMSAAIIGNIPPAWITIPLPRALRADDQYSGPVLPEYFS